MAHVFKAQAMMVSLMRALKISWVSVVMSVRRAVVGLTDRMMRRSELVLVSASVVLISTGVVLLSVSRSNVMLLSWVYDVVGRSMFIPGRTGVVLIPTSVLGSFAVVGGGNMVFLSWVYDVVLIPTSVLGSTGVVVGKSVFWFWNMLVLV